MSKLMWNSDRPTLAIYGIQDCVDGEYPGAIHDHNMALFHHGELKKLVQLERVTRNKRDNKMQQHLISLLRDENLIGKELDVVFVDHEIGRAFISADGQIRFEAPLRDKLTCKPERGYLKWFDSSNQGWSLSHEMSHIATTLPFCGSWKENSLLVHYDGGASCSNFSVWHYHNKEVNLVNANWNNKDITSLHNANALTFAIVGAKRFDQNSVPGKIMGFGSFGEDLPEIRQWLRKHDYFKDIWKSKRRFFEIAKKEMGITLSHFDQHHPFIQNIAASIQGEFEDRLLSDLRNYREITGATNLYYSGGCALNIKANSKIIEQNIFDHVVIPPCCEDSGLALGAGAWIEFLKHGKLQPHTAYLNNWNLPEQCYSYAPNVIEEIAQRIMKGEVFATCIDYGESGPRALGNRSIIAKASSREIADKVSQYHKRREWYRPIAPIMLKRNADRVTQMRIHELSKYMLLDYAIKSEYQKLMEGVTHVDNTSRIQYIENREDHPLLYDLLDHMEKRYGELALINTSFNQQGEPIVHSYEQALISAKNLKIDGVIGRGVLKLIDL
ncbi:carbamoyltransferase C-terminal domain-containing protein [Prolixibacteraceae bacterium]|nr:carbamoyltransferase C-terminal domain-containing protein [Prolixibacteraceae bacterium]